MVGRRGRCLLAVSGVVALAGCGEPPNEHVGRTLQPIAEAGPWHRFFGSFGDLAGRKPKKLPMWLAGTLAALNQVLPLGLPLNKERIEHYEAKPVYSRAKTRALGWEPKISWDEGMRTSAAWLREIGKL